MEGQVYICFPYKEDEDQSAQAEDEGPEKTEAFCMLLYKVTQRIRATLSKTNSATGWGIKVPVSLHLMHAINAGM